MNHILSNFNRVKYALYRFIIVVFLINHFSVSVKAQSISNEGTEFWVCFPSHVPSGSFLANMSVFITSKSNTSGRVICGNFNQSYTVLANQVKEVLIPRNQSYINTGSGISINKGIKVTVDAGKPKVVVYAHVFAGARSAATLVLPYEALGQKHYAMSYTQEPVDLDFYYSQFNIVAVDPNTKVNITPVSNGIKGTPFSITLNNVGDVYQYQNNNDISGSLIEVDTVVSACKKIAVFSGSSSLIIPSPTCTLTFNEYSLDPLIQQLYPIESWGLNFSAIPFYERNTGSIFRILASEDNTAVTIDGSTYMLNAGQYYTSPPIYKVSLIKANKPVSVAQFALTQLCADSRNSRSFTAVFSDPDMVLLNPLEYSIDRITLYSSKKLAINEQFLNVTIPTKGVKSFKINNIDLSAKFQFIPTDNSYSYAQILLHELGGTDFSLSADTGFNAIAYGFGNVESYAYSAGTNLASNTIVNALKSNTNDVVRIACIDDQYDFKILLPYITTQLTWQLDNADAKIIQNNPTYTSVTLGKRTLYEYKLSAQKTFSTSGIKQVKVQAALQPNANVCSTVDIDSINFDFEVSDLPEAEFTSAGAVCPGAPITFTYVEKNIGEPVNSWLWDFGDGTTSSLTNPTHTYLIPGNYKVKLILGSNIGCISNAAEKNILVAEPPKSLSKTTSPLCINKPIQFKDISTSKDGAIIFWLWDFGDGTTSTLQNPTHTFSQSGSFLVKLTTTTIYNCENTGSTTYVINDPAEITFADPGSCINDVVKFKAEVLKGNVVSWLWDFGDGSNDQVENVKAEPSHKYLATGVYNVTLQAVSSDACVSTITKSITISGANPQVAFEVLDKNSLCSNKTVYFKNNSSILFGNITKIEWIFDFNGSNPVIVADNTPTVGEIYTHKYPSLGTNKNYQVVLRAYSGIVCFQESAPVTIQLNASPAIIFNQPNTVCLNTPTFIIEAKDNNQLGAAQKFEGAGVVNGNYFNPLIAGIGEHEITYSIITSKGCTDTVKRKIKVIDVPEIDPGKDLDILLAGEKQIDAKVIKGQSLKYKWSPALGLSADSILNPIANPTETTKYTLTVSSQEGCEVLYEVLVTVHIDPNIPNAFSPNNGDNVNDTWSIKFLETFTNATIRIFNRNGQEVFYAKQYNTPWDGKLKGVDMPVGVYYYIIEPNNGRNRYTGSVTILR